MSYETTTLLDLANKYKIGLYYQSINLEPTYDIELFKKLGCTYDEPVAYTLESKAGDIKEHYEDTIFIPMEKMSMEQLDCGLQNLEQVLPDKSHHSYIISHIGRIGVVYGRKPQTQG